MSYLFLNPILRQNLEIIGDFFVMFTGAEDRGHSASAVHPEDCWFLLRDLKSHSSLYPNEARRCPFISPNNGLMFLQMEQETGSRSEAKLGLDPGQVGLEAGEGEKRQTDFSAFPWGKKKKKKKKCVNGKDFRDVREVKINKPLL